MEFRHEFEAYLSKRSTLRSNSSTEMHLYVLCLLISECKYTIINDVTDHYFLSFKHKRIFGIFFSEIKPG